MFFDGASNTAPGSCTVLSCHSLNFTGWAGTFQHAAATTIVIGGAAAAPSNTVLTLVAGMTYTLGNSATSALSFGNSSGTQQTITTGGKTVGNFTISATGGSFILGSALTSTGTVTLTQGTFATNNLAISCSVFNSNNSNTRTFTPGSSAITCTLAGEAITMTTTTNLTITANTAAFTLNGASASTRTAMTTWNGSSISYTGGGTMTFNNGGTACTYANITVTGTAVKTDNITVGANPPTASGTMTLSGNSVINRLLVQSSTRGTARTLTAATVTCSNLDIMDMTGAGAGSWNIAAITGNSGDCGGNTSITFTTASAQTATGTASFTWSTHGWTTRVPLPQDDVTISNAFVASQTVTIDMPRIGKGINFGGSTGTPTLSWSAATELYGSLTFASTNVHSGTNTVTLAGRSSFTVTTAATTSTMPITINAPSGTYTLQDNLTNNRSGVALTLTLGTFVDNTKTVTLSGGSAVYSMTGGTLTKTGIWNFSTTGVITFWNATGGTVSDTSSIVLTVASANTRTFAGGGLVYGTLTYTVAGSTGQLTITGSNSFQDINFSDVTNARTIKLTSATTTTIRATHGLTGVVGTSGKLMTVSAVTAASAATIAFSNGYGGGSDYLSVQDITATTNTWYAGTNSTNVSGNTNVTFTAPPNTANKFMLMGIG